ncbi:H-NS family nucleoid-associated regulatory protein [Paraburkholderia phymatum]|uniref:Histone family protein nucleoid-structuring protein H-NS n=1 Tax=Paraburkholderia phymatum (strain DSM 17167 / CIP 108236 / LMG 21445 / STM815) TaxID=391038 RepID=B2JEN2_PARP8|nr:H-NS family nucleoid-associated regulatory protein [Paraburkholderia phymatum]ACC71347.1 histone family protein nucleoid-structuring protein H-NS [Paraburkholderia phymatum STM815]
MDERKRDSMIAYLRRRMAQVGIKATDLAAALAQERRARKAVRFRSASGETWDGKGAMPQWLSNAVSAGQSAQHFAIDKPAKAAKEERRGVDWRNDPFAGTRLATVPVQ